MDLLDENGDLFGVVNAVDAVAVLLVLVILAAGSVALLAPSQAGTSSEPIITQVVEVRSTGHAANVTDLVREGPVAAEGVIAVENKSVQPSGDDYTLVLRVRLRIETTSEGLSLFRGERLYIGKRLSLDLGGVTISGVVTSAAEPETIRGTLTPVPTKTKTSTPTSTETSTPTRTEIPTSTPEETRLVTLRTSVPNETANQIVEGSISTAGIVAIENKTVFRYDETATVVLDVRLAVEVTEDGTVLFRGVQLEEGQRLRLNLDSAIVTGEILRIHSDRSA